MNEYTKKFNDFCTYKPHNTTNKKMMIF